jgi:hypothetical protein
MYVPDSPSAPAAARLCETDSSGQLPISATALARLEGYCDFRLAQSASPALQTRAVAAECASDLPTLPPEIMARILSYLAYCSPERSACARVCTEWAGIARQQAQSDLATVAVQADSGLPSDPWSPLRKALLVARAAEGSAQQTLSRVCAKLRQMPTSRTDWKAAVHLLLHMQQKGKEVLWGSLRQSLSQGLAAGCDLWQPQINDRALWSVPDFVIEAIRQPDISLRFAAEDLRDRRIVVLAAVHQDPTNLIFASERLKGDKEIVLRTVQRFGRALHHASRQLQDDREVVLAAVTQDGSALLWASQRLRDDREIVLAAIQSCGLALEYASERLRSLREIVLSAVCRNGWALRHAGHYENDPEIALAALSRSGLALQVASRQMCDLKAIVLIAVQSNGMALQDASERLRDDKEVVLAAVAENGSALRWASERLRRDRKVVLAAVHQNPEAWRFVPETLRSDPECRAVYSNHTDARATAHLNSRLRRLHASTESLYGQSGSHTPPD